ncbi:ABC transporter ATP-binding protein [Dactylosporangium sp. NPDC000521]|uniref:ABC transporter ATP-binding protein n=1 Tax=Dactylosporangium sp. NPDC000521 TaxID=3363975 RepID=UPI0036834989
MIQKSYKSGSSHVRALGGVSLRVTAGELVAVMGPSGCGKSTLLAIAGGLLPPDRGEVRVTGAPLSELRGGALHSLRRKAIGYVFQDYNLMRTLTAAENVALPDELSGVRRSEAKRRALAALDAVGMARESDRFPDQLSGGQQQRVALARAITGDRSLILADEPTGALDSATAKSVLDVLRRLVDRGAGCVMVTHDAAVAARADRVVTMRDGTIDVSAGEAQ